MNSQKGSLLTSFSFLTEEEVDKMLNFRSGDILPVQIRFYLLTNNHSPVTNRLVRKEL